MEGMLSRVYWQGSSTDQACIRDRPLHRAKTASTVIGKLKRRFESYGIPDVLHKDNLLFIYLF